MRRMHTLGVAVLAATLLPTLSGCGTPGTPQPPSLNLPAPVSDLAAQRLGNRVTLTWTMPRRNTDKLLLHGLVRARVCRAVGLEDCAQAGGDLQLAPGAPGAFTETLPAALTSGEARPLRYRVELLNGASRSAGLSNTALVVAGSAPRPLTEIHAELRKQGAVLHWKPEANDTASIRIHRKLLTPSPAKPKEGPLTPQPEPLEQSLLVPDAAASGRALDRGIRFGASYEYQLERVARVSVDGLLLELPGERSAPLHVDAIDSFPPQIPTSLAAVSSTDESGKASVDLNWQPSTDADLDGYIVYRAEGSGEWLRLSGPQPVATPAFHDITALPGHSYSYAVSAIDREQHESPRSTAAHETVPEENR